MCILVKPPEPRWYWGGSTVNPLNPSGFGGVRLYLILGDAPEEGDDVEGGKYDKTQDEDELEEDLVEGSLAF